MTKFGCCDRDRSCSFAVPDLLPGHAVLRELIYERARQDIVEELVDLSSHRALRTLLPGRTPENRKHLDRRKQRPVSVRELRRCCRRCCRRFRGGLAYGVGDTQGDDANRGNVGRVYLLGGT